MPEITPLIIAEHRSFETDDSPASPAPAGVSVTTARKPGSWLYQLYQDKLLKAEPVYFGDYYPPPWKELEQTRYLDSLVKGMPVQGLCLGCDVVSGRYIVLDGQQRVFSLTRFLSGGNWTLAKANDIDPRIAGQKASAFKDKKNSLHAIYRRVESYKFMVTVIKYDPTDKTHLDYLFTVFFRMNTGGVRLNNQEMRHSLYRGPLNDLLFEFDGDKNWLAVQKMKQAGDFRYTKQEVILRFLAFYDKYQAYDGRLSFFLNTYMAERRRPSKLYFEEKRKLFRDTAEILAGLAFPPPPAAQNFGIFLMVCTMLGIAFNLENLKKQTGGKAQKMFERLLRDEKFSDDYLIADLTGRENVIARIETAKKIFSGK